MDVSIVLLIVVIIITLLSGVFSRLKGNTGTAMPEQISVTMSENNPENEMDSTYYPFLLFNFEGQFSISCEIEFDEYYNKYLPLFEKYGYSGNGPCWEGHITQILEKTKPELLQHIQFNSEAGMFSADVDTKQNQLLSAQLLSPIFSDLSKLEEYIKKADKTRISD